jgi:hypothetical protein
MIINQCPTAPVPLDLRIMPPHKKKPSPDQERIAELEKQIAEQSKTIGAPRAFLNDILETESH